MMDSGRFGRASLQSQLTLTPSLIMTQVSSRNALPFKVGHRPKHNLLETRSALQVLEIASPRRGGFRLLHSEVERCTDNDEVHLDMAVICILSLRSSTACYDASFVNPPSLRVRA